MSLPANKTKNASSKNSDITRSTKRHPRRKKGKKTVFGRILKWIKRNPLKTIAIICSCILIYITILFFLYDKEKKTLNQNHPMEIESK
jgi:predicted PurR-regulated permease PerM